VPTISNVRGDTTVFAFLPTGRTVGRQYLPFLHLMVALSAHVGNDASLCATFYATTEHLYTYFSLSQPPYLRIAYDGCGIP